MLGHVWSHCLCMYLTGLKLTGKQWNFTQHSRRTCVRLMKEGCFISSTTMRFCFRGIFACLYNFRLFDLGPLLNLVPLICDCWANQLLLYCYNLLGNLWSLILFLNTFRFSDDDDILIIFFLPRSLTMMIILQACNYFIMWLEKFSMG